MAIVTLWVLYGDDIRLVATEKPADPYFFITFLICLVLFILELIANSVVLDDYKFSFFFWLDVVAVLSMIPDIPYIYEPLFALFGVEIYNVDVEVDTSSSRDTRASSYTSRVLGSIRFIRLVRIVKLYKYFSKSKIEEEQH